MPEFEDVRLCRAPASEVWKLLFDPARFPEWWAGMDRVEQSADGITRYMAAWPDFAYPTQVLTRTEESRVVISCMLSDIVHEWSLEPADVGCAVRIRIDVPEQEAARLGAVAVESTESLERLVALAESSV
jgi:uncharacterized protein YndB with AHSA1/START domain